MDRLGRDGGGGGGGVKREKPAPFTKDQTLPELNQIFASQKLKKGAVSK